jgi:ABC-type phosphate/phosphonate transport system permease subunit
MLHTIGSLTKLFYEAVESAQDKPVRGLAACGASHLQRIRFALWPQVKPIFSPTALCGSKLTSARQPFSGWWARAASARS